MSIDAGSDRVLNNAMGNTVLSFDARGHKVSAKYDALHRPVEKRVTGNGLDHTVERLEYGEGVSDAIARNLRGQLYRHFDQSGLATTGLYDITGKPRQSSKKVRADYKTEANWPKEEAERVKLLEDETFYAELVYDALGRVRLQTNPDTSVVRPEFHQSGRLNKLHVKLNGAEIETEFVTGITYNPKGQRETISYGNGTITGYGYERETFRLTSLVTTRTIDSKSLQDISYVYDPVGNIVKIRDDSHNRVFTSGGPVEPEMAFAYDALYRLTAATGRTHNALGGHEDRDPSTFKQSQWTKLDDLGQLSQYTERFTYDLAGNLTKLEHQGKNSFTRDIIIHSTSNRGLLRTQTFEPSPDADWVSANYFDANGNQMKFDHLAGVSWNYRDNLASTTLISRSTDNNDAEYYVYDSTGQRTRKVKETFENGESGKRVAEKIYLGGVEIKRVKTVDMSTQVETRILDRSDLHVMDDKQRIAIVPRWKKDDLLTEIEDRSWLDTNRVRYQFGNHLGSASLELDGRGQLISYEEYFPYGGTAFIAGSSQAEVKLKEYRYTGKERDDSTGFYYYGARYYAPWLGRWLSADPAGPVDGPNLYVYVSGNPVMLRDPEGTNEDDPTLGVALKVEIKDPELNRIVSALEKMESGGDQTGSIPAKLRNASGMPATWGVSQIGADAAVTTLRGGGMDVAKAFGLTKGDLTRLAQVARATAKHFENISNIKISADAASEGVEQAISSYLTGTGKDFGKETGLTDKDAENMLRASLLEEQIMQYKADDIDTFMARESVSQNIQKLGFRKTDINAYRNRPRGREHKVGFITKAVFNAPGGDIIRAMMTHESGTMMGMLTIRRSYGLIKKAEASALSEGSIVNALSAEERAQLAAAGHNLGITEGKAAEWVKRPSSQKSNPYVIKFMGFYNK